jgi:1-acyl-sn-glycerol-3-phosphate acyltransferase
MGSPLLGAARLLAYLAVTLAGIPVQMVLLALGSRAAASFPRAYHALCARIVGLDVRTFGSPSAARPTLFVSNHSSYLDITVLGSLIEGSFVAKSEVGTWPLFGLLARLQRTVFVDRRARNSASHRDDMKGRLEAGDSLVLFPEGTSSDGNRVLPFKSTLFAVAGLRVEGTPLVVQPVSVAAARLDGIPLGRTLRCAYAWYGGMELARHLWAMVGLGRLEVEVEFHEPVTVERFGSRKALAEHCRREVAAGVERTVAGRRGPAAAPRAGAAGGEPDARPGG